MPHNGFSHLGTRYKEDGYQQENRHQQVGCQRTKGRPQNGDANLQKTDIRQS